MANGKESFEIRPCTLDDEYGACAVCLSTGDSGKDGSKYYDDPNILGYRYVSPYIHFSPGLGFVLESDDRQICGYVLGTLESNQFYQRYVNEWLPKMRKLYPRIPTVEECSKRDRSIIHDFHHDTVDSFKQFDGYPSHLHIDLLPRAQGKGYGKRMIQRIEMELVKLGSKGVHLEMAADNVRALGFYQKLGFMILDGNEHVLWLGKKFE